MHATSSRSAQSNNISTATELAICATMLPVTSTKCACMFQGFLTIAPALLPRVRQQNKVPVIRLLQRRLVVLSQHKSI